MRFHIFLLVLLISCTSNEVPSGIMPPQKMKEVVFDMIRADEYSINYLANDTSKNIRKERVILYEKVFALHKTTKDEFFKSFQYYQQHPDMNKVLFDSLMSHSKKIREQKTPLQPLQELKLN